jgi:uncharacterized protein (DUF2236 family)
MAGTTPRGPLSAQPPAAPRAPEPGTAVWRYFGDLRNGLLGPSLLVLQVAHPTVGAGVLQHSHFREEPWRRLVRTFVSLSVTIYGGQAGATAEAARLRRLHATIRGVDDRGRRYHALDPDAYLWVLATLIRGGVDGHRWFGAGFPPGRIDEYYDQMRDVGRILGLRERHLPPDWASFCAYHDEVVASRLEDNQAVRDVVDSVRSPARPARWLPGPVWRPVARVTGGLAYLVTVGTLPPVLRDRLGLTWDARQERRLRRFRRVVRAGMALVVPPLRIAGALAAARWSISRTARR